MKHEAIGTAEWQPEEASSAGVSTDVRLAAATDSVSEQLLALALEAPITDGVGPVTRHFVHGAGRLLSEYAHGACVVDDISDEPHIATYLPRDADPDPGRDPARLFPRFSREQVHELLDGSGGSTFHVAWNGDPDTLPLDQQVVVERLLHVAGATLRRARDFDRLHRADHNLRKLQAQVIQAEKLASLGQIVAGVVHELNNPLTSIIAYSDYLKKRALLRQGNGESVDDDLERLRRIGEAAERILRFARDLVAYARPAGDVPGAVDLRAVIDKALVFCEHEFNQYQVQVRRDVPVELHPVRGIGGQLTQVFVNLFTNAAHAMSAGGGTLHIRAEHSADCVLVHVSDEGVGIAPDSMEQIFEPFFTTKVDGRGTGLGLSIVRDIVAAHGGTLKAHSVPDEGAEFTVSLPMAALPFDVRHKS